MKPMVFFNIAWMERYEGLLKNDEEICGGGQFIEENGYGYEIFNFKKIRGKVYGYVKPSGGDCINLRRISGIDEDLEFIDNVLVIFTAPHKNGGTYIVGWYKDARVYREYQETKNKERKFRNEYLGYYSVADAKNVTLLGITDRLLFPKIPRKIKGGMGQSNIWYADADNIEMSKFHI